MALSFIKKIPVLFRGITSKHHDNFCCMNYLHSFVIESKQESHKIVGGKKDFCNVVMLSEDTIILALNQYQFSHKA